MTWLSILAYLTVQILIGVWIARRIKSESDFLLGGRRLSLFMVSFSFLSTIDSILIAISALISHNLIVPHFNLKNERNQVLSARVVVVLAGLFAYFLAITSEGIMSLVITLMGFYSKIGGPKSANMALLGGLLAWPLSEYIFHIQAPYLVSIATAMVLCLWGTRGSERKII